MEMSELPLADQSLLVVGCLSFTPVLAAYACEFLQDACATQSPSNLGILADLLLVGRRDAPATFSCTENQWK